MEACRLCCLAYCCTSLLLLCPQPPPPHPTTTSPPASPSALDCLPACLQVNAPPGPARTEVMQIADIFRAHAVDCSDVTTTLQVTGDVGKVRRGWVCWGHTPPAACAVQGIMRPVRFLGRFMHCSAAAQHPMPCCHLMPSCLAATPAVFVCADGGAAPCAGKVWCGGAGAYWPHLAQAGGAHV